MAGTAGHRRRLVACVTASLLLVVLLTILEYGTEPDLPLAVGKRRLAAAENNDGSGESLLAAGEGEDQSYTVRLNFINATWPSILQKVAEETGSELVMQRAPRGRFTRFDRTRYSRTDAVRILNREIEPKGFRLLEQGRFLVVLNLDSLRTRYQRPLIPTDDASETSSAAQRTNPQAGLAESGPRNEASGSGVFTIAGHDEPSRGSPSRPAVGNGEVENPDRAGASIRSPRRLPAFADAAAAQQDEEPPQIENNPPPSEFGTSRPLVVSAARRGAKQVAGIIYTALKERSELIDDGPEHLPAFRVYQNADFVRSAGSLPQSGGRADRRRADEIQFTVGIDVEGEELLVEAARQRQQAVADLIRTIDQASVPAGSELRLVTSDRDVTRIAEQLRPALRQIIAENRRRVAAGLLQQPQPGAARAQNQPGGGNQPPPPDGAAQPQEPPLLSLEQLRGPVTIQEIPGIGYVIIGNPDDVDAVARIIRQLEELAAGAAPIIRILPLTNVNSEALADLLNTVYQDLTILQTAGEEDESQASFIPIVRPNALLVLAARDAMPGIIELVDELDQPVDPRTEFQVFPLKNAIASQVVDTLTTLYQEQQQADQAAGAAALSPRIRAVADVRTNTVIVQAAPRDLVEVAFLIRRIDRDSSAGVNRIQVFPLKNAVADELAEVINTALQSLLNPPGAVGGQVGVGVGVGAGVAGQAAQELRDAKSVVLEFLTAEGDAQRIIRSGILADIRVTADVRVNSLIVTAPEQSMPLMAELIRQLDQPTSNVAEIKVFTLTNSDATAMAELLETLFEAEDGDAQAGFQVVGAEDASSGLIPLRFSVDIRTNSIIAIGAAEALRVVEAILLRLDETDIRQRQNRVIKLKHSPAADVADAINAFLQSQRDLAQIDPELISNVELLEQEIIVVPELVSNSLLLSATPRYFREILEIIETLDQAPAQVIIQVLIVQVDLQNTDEFGVELGFQDELLFDRGLLNAETFQTITNSVTNPGTGVVTTTEQIVNQELLPGFLFNNQQLGNNTAVMPGSVGQQALTNFSLGRINGDLGFGGLVLSASSESVSVLIRALAAQRNVQILSRPQIRTVDNQLGSVQVGQQVPVITGATTNALGGITPTLGTPQQVGIILQVTPRITPDGIVVMETIVNKSAFAGQGIPIITDPTTGAVVESPIFDLSEAVATIAVPDGQTVVLGGMITKTDDTLERKVPWLGDIPLLGTAFRFDSTIQSRTELLIFMTPRIVKNAADSELIKQVESERLHFIVEDAEEVHGPIFAVPPATSYDGCPPGGFLPDEGIVVPPQPENGEDVPTTIMPRPLPRLPGNGMPPANGSPPANGTTPDTSSFPGLQFPNEPGGIAAEAEQQTPRNTARAADRSHGNEQRPVQRKNWIRRLASEWKFK